MDARTLSRPAGNAPFVGADLLMTPPLIPGNATGADRAPVTVDCTTSEYGCSVGVVESGLGAAGTVT
jgi:hypothetical protein